MQPISEDGEVVSVTEPATDEKNQQDQQLLDCPKEIKQQSTKSLSGNKKKQLVHFQYGCPGLTGADCQTDIRPLSFQTLFRTKLIIPLLQRTYCWTDPQIQGWYRDAIGSGGARTTGLHTTGKCMLYRVGGPTSRAAPGGDSSSTMWLIDGQQRVTTHTLLLASLRDAALQLKTRACDGATTSTGRNEPTRTLDAIVDRLESLLFPNVPAMRRWIADLVGDNASASKNSTTPSAAGLDLATGQELPFDGGATLLPSFGDRAPYFELLLLGRYNFERCRRQHALDAAVAPPQTIKAVPSFPSRQRAAKTYFDDKIAAMMRDGGDTTAVAKLERAVSRSHRMALMYVEPLNEIDMAQVFLWLQEISVLNILHNPSPGVFFGVSDMIRNLVLTTVMDWPVQAQEDFYRTRWLEPLELRFQRSNCYTAGKSNEPALDLDTVITKFVEGRRTVGGGITNTSTTNKSPMKTPGGSLRAKLLCRAPIPPSKTIPRSHSAGNVYKGHLEKIVEKTFSGPLMAVGGADRFKAMFIYGRFHSLVEEKEIRSGRVERDDDGVVLISDETYWAVLDELIRFARSLTETLPMEAC